MLTLGDMRCISVGLLVVTNVLLCWRVYIMEKAGIWEITMLSIQFFL